MPIGCDVCTRRAVLHGIGLAVAGTIVGCGGGGDTPDAAVDAGACPATDLCLDTSLTANAALASPGGSLVVTSSAGKLVVVRTSATAAAALSAICTHQGCTVAYQATNMLLQCPCHGAQFGLDGTVKRSPAVTPLKTYAATVSGSTITIKLA